jgi:hypothetical protein
MIEALTMTDFAAGYHEVKASKFEQDLAAWSVALLRDVGFSDEEIILGFTFPRPRIDKAYERQIWVEEKQRVSAARVKLEMRRLVTH